MITTTPLTLNQQAKDWLANNQDWAAGLPAEVLGVKIKLTSFIKPLKKGHKHTPGSCPAQTCTWWKDGYNTTVGAPAPMGQVVKGYNPELMTVDNNGNKDTEPSAKDLAGWRAQGQAMMNATGTFPAHKVIDYSTMDHPTKQGLTSPWPTLADVRGDLPLPTMAPLAAPQMSPYWAAKADTQVLNDTTWTTFNAKTRSLWAAKGIHTGRKYQIKVAQLEMQLKVALSMNDRRRNGVQIRQADVEAIDHSFINAQNLTALVETLIKGGMTQKQMSLLEDRAFGVSTSGKHRLVMAAQRKAQAILAA